MNLPPKELRRRVGWQVEDEDFLSLGRRCVADIERAVPERSATAAVGLDFGCGCGRMLRHLLGVFPETQWYACDPDVEAVRWVVTGLPAATAFAIRPMSHIPLPDVSVDTVVAVSVFSHLKDWSFYLMELRRVLAHHGVLAMSTLGGRSYEHKMELPHSELTEPLINDVNGYPDNKDYGNVFCPAGWAAAEVGRFFHVLDDIPAGLAGYQDLLIAEKDCG